MAKRREKQRVKEELESIRTEQERRRSIASMEQARELWRLQDEERARKREEQKRLQDEARMRAGGGHKRQAVGSQVSGPCAKRTAVSGDSRPLRYGDQIMRHKMSNQMMFRTRSLRERPVDYNGELPSFLREEYEYMANMSLAFPEEITADIQMSCLSAYQAAISRATIRMPCGICGICGGLFKGNSVRHIYVDDENLRYYLHTTQTNPDSCAVANGELSPSVLHAIHISRRRRSLFSLQGIL